MLQKIPLIEDERKAVEEGVEFMEKLCNKLADVPTPTGPTPREIKDTFIPSRSSFIPRIDVCFR
jgi:hypothetical protein